MLWSHGLSHWHFLAPQSVPTALFLWGHEDCDGHVTPGSEREMVLAWPGSERVKLIWWRVLLGWCFFIRPRNEWQERLLIKEWTFLWFGMIYFSWDHSWALFFVRWTHPAQHHLSQNGSPCVLPGFSLGSCWLLSCYGNCPIFAPALFGMCGRMSNFSNHGWCWCSCFEASLQLVLRFFYHFFLRNKPQIGFPEMGTLGSVLSWPGSRLPPPYGGVWWEHPEEPFLLGTGEAETRLVQPSGRIPRCGESLKAYSYLPTLVQIRW